jgi:RHS repeat-associated protein
MKGASDYPVYTASVTTAWSYEFGFSRTADVSLGSLPGAGGRYPVSDTFTDALGRETNSVRAVISGEPLDLAYDASYAPLATSAEYPYGTDNYRVTTDPQCVQTVSHSWYGQNSKISETASAGVTNRTTRIWGGAVIEETCWDGKWTRETRSAAYDASGRRVETVAKEASDLPVAVVASETVYDFLGRAVCVTTPLGVTSNFYDGSSTRLLRVTRPGSPDTLYVYDELGDVAVTALDVNADGQVSYAGTDRISSTVTRYEEDTNAWWRVTSSAVWNMTGEDACLTSAVTRVRMTGLGTPAPTSASANAVLAAQAETLDWRGNVTRTSTYTDAGAVSVWQVTETPVSVLPGVQKAVAGYPVSVVSYSSVTNSYTYDGFARQTSATDGRDNASVTHYNAFGQADYTEDAAANRTSYAYDAFGRRTAITDPLTNTVFTAYDSLGNVAAQWGAVYPVEYGYDSQGRKISMKTFRVENGNGDETRWIYNNVTGLLTNKVYADCSRVTYTYTAAGRLASRVWARGVTTAYTFDALGQLTEIDYGDATPDITFAYDRIGNMVSVSDASGTRVFTRDLDGQTLSDTLSALGQDFMLLESYDTFGRSTGYAVSNTMNSVSSLITGTVQTYDPFGRISQVTVAGVASPFRYDYLTGTDLQCSLAIPNGVMRETAYESARDLPASVVCTNAAGTVLTWRTFARDAAGNLSGRTQYRLGDATNRVDAFAQNERGELVYAAIGTNVYSYAFDPIGNRMMAEEPDFSAAYSANSHNQYTRISNAVPAAEFVPEYDADGNQTLLKTSTGIWRVTFNAENRPVIFSNDTAVIEMVYDFQGRRFDYIETVGGTVARHERYLYRGYLQIAALDLLEGTNVLHTVAWDPSEPAATRPLVLLQGTNWWCYGFDQVKNVTELFNDSGVIAATYDYAPFGAVTASSGSVAAVNPITFSSEISDAVLGLVYYNYRPLDILNGRWLTKDPIGDRGGKNLYCFVRNNVVNGIDSLGLKECECPQERIWIEIEKMMKQAIEKTKNNPIMIDYNWDKKISKTVYYVPVYREFGGYICCDKKRGRVSSTGPYPGTWRFMDATGNEFNSDNPVMLAKGNGVPTMGNITDAPSKQCGKGLTAVVFYHSHPNGPNLSPSDIGFSNDNNLPIAGGAVGAKYFWLYSQSYGTILTEY